MKTVKVAIISGKKIERSIDLPAGPGTGKTITINAVDKGKYIFAEDGTGVAPENITAKRVGNDLYVSTEGTDTEDPQLIIKDFYQHPGELVGMGEDGAYHQYVTTDGIISHEAANLPEGTAVPLALGSDDIPGFADGLVADSNNYGLYAALAGLGLLGLGLLGAAIANNHHHSSNHSDNGDGNSATSVAPGTIDAVTDNVGDKQGDIPNGGATDDNTPTFSGGGVTPGDTVVIIDNGKEIGSATADGNGDWSFTPDTSLPDGNHAVVVVVVDPDGEQSAPSDPVIVVVDTVAPAPATGTLNDDAGEIVGPIADNSVTDDNTPTFNGKAEPGSVVTVSDNGTVIGSAAVDGDGNWNFTPSTPLDDGSHSFNTVVTDDAGNVSVPSESIDFTVDTSGSMVSIQSVTDDVAPIVGDVANNGYTNDALPTLNGMATANSTVNIYDNGVKIASTTSDAAGKWSVTPSQPLSEGANSLTATVVTEANGESAPSGAFVINLDTTSPDIPSVVSPDNFTVVDDVGSVQGPLAFNDVTDDNIPTISGMGEQPGQVITVFDGGEIIGSAVVNDEGRWSMEPETALADGEHTITLTATDEAGNTSAPSDAFDFTVDTSTTVVNGSSEDFDSAENRVFHTGDSVTLASGMTMTCISQGIDGSAVNSATEITNKGIALFVPEFGHKAMMQLAESSMQYSFPDPAQAVSFNVNSSNYAGNTVEYYDANGTLLHSQELPVQPDESVAKVGWTAPEGEMIASIIITVGDEGHAENPNQVDGLRIDALTWGDAAVQSADTHSAQPQALALSDTHSGDVSTLSQLYTAAGINEQQGIVHLQDNTNLVLSIDDVLAHASKNMFIDDGKEQFAVQGNESDTVHIDAADWSSIGSATVGGVVYDTYQQNTGMAELLIQHSIDILSN